MLDLSLEYGFQGLFSAGFRVGRRDTTGPEPQQGDILESPSPPVPLQ